jgi:hypothetical protein
VSIAALATGGAIQLMQLHRHRHSRGYPKTKQSRDREGAVFRFVAEKPLADARGSDRKAVLG